MLLLEAPLNNPLVKFSRRLLENWDKTPTRQSAFNSVREWSNRVCYVQVCRASGFRMVIHNSSLQFWRTNNQTKTYIIGILDRIKKGTAICASIFCIPRP